MAKKKIKFNAFSPSGVESALKQLDEYKKSILDKCELFCRRLAEKGITVAEQHTGKFGSHITFDVQTSRFPDGAQAILIATNTSLIHVRWIGAGVALGEADISPLMMAEFGSGLPAQQNPRGPEFGMGTGTFPGQTHAWDPDGWWYQDLEGEWHHSYGETPTMPMSQASKAMIKAVRQTAREVFK